MLEKIEETLEFIWRKTGYRPKIAIILGSGLGGFADKIKDKNVVNYEDIPNFPVSTVKGHEGKLIFGKIGGKEVVVMQGRFHFYEGYSMKELTYPLYVMQKMGINSAIVTNAAGGLKKSFTPGDLMLIEDHINLMGTNPLIGENYEEFGVRFPDMSEPYNLDFLKKGEDAFIESGITIKKGVYAAVTGPSYETKAEIRYLALIGADTVGMSTVPEVITLNYLGIKCVGISCITNLATGIAEKPHKHEDVVKSAAKSAEKLAEVIEKIIEKI